VRPSSMEGRRVNGSALAKGGLERGTLAGQSVTFGSSEASFKYEQLIIFCLLLY